MWKPHYVVKESKPRANLVWAIMLAAILGFTVVQITMMALKRRNPDTNYKVSDDIFHLPYMEVCFDPGNGCDANWNPSECIATVQSVVNDPCSHDVNVSVTSKSSNCVAFDLEQLDVDRLGECIDNRGMKPYIDLEMAWVISHDAGGERAFGSNVPVFLGGPEGGQLTNVPYTRLLRSSENMASETRIASTEMTIGKNVRKKLSGSCDVTYPTLTISTTEYVVANQSDLTTGGGESSIGYLSLTLTLGSFSSAELSDIDPTDILGLISSIGGFWGFLLGVWSFFFISTVESKPEEKARNFKKDIEKGKRLLRRKRSSPPNAVTSDAQAGGDEQSNWDIAHGGPLEAIGNTNSDRVPEIESTV